MFVWKYSGVAWTVLIYCVTMTHLYECLHNCCSQHKKYIVNIKKCFETPLCIIISLLDDLTSNNSWIFIYSIGNSWLLEVTHIYSDNSHDSCLQHSHQCSASGWQYINCIHIYLLVHLFLILCYVFYLDINAYLLEGELNILDHRKHLCYDLLWRLSSPFPSYSSISSLSISVFVVTICHSD